MAMESRIWHADDQIILAVSATALSLGCVFYLLVSHLFLVVALLALFGAYYATKLSLESLLVRSSKNVQRTYSTLWLANLVEYAFNVYRAFKDPNYSSAATDNQDSSSSFYTRHGCGTGVDPELRVISRCICNDYIKPWYTYVSDNADFIVDCENGIYEIFVSLAHEHVLKLTPKEIALSAVSTLKDGLLEVSNSETFVQTERELSKYILNYLLAKSCPNNLRPLLRRKAKTVRKNSEDAALIMCRELLIDAAFVPLISLIADPNFLNWAVVNSLSESVGFASDDEQRESVGTTNYTGADILLRQTDSSRSWPTSPVVEHKPSFSISRSKSVEAFIKYYTSSEMETRVGACQFLDQSTVPEVSEVLDLELFTNMCIPKTEEIRSQSETYVVYCIQYDALFEEVVPADETVCSTLVKRRVCLSRRFKEFENLQRQLMDNPILKPHLVNLKKPSKLKRETQNLFGRLDDKTVEYRRTYLEQYLIELCSVNVICQSPEFQEFLGYVNDSKSGSKGVLLSLRPLKLERLLSRSLKEAFNMLKVALPLDISSDDSSNHPLKLPRYSTKGILFNYSHCSKLCKALEDEAYHDAINVILTNETTKQNERYQRKSLPAKEEYKPLPVLGPRLQGDGCDKSDTSSEVAAELAADLQREIPLTDNFIDIVFLVFFPKSALSSPVVTLLKITLGQAVERLLVKLMEFWLTEETLSYLLHCLHESLWTDPPDQRPMVDTSRAAVIQTVCGKILPKPLHKGSVSWISRILIARIVDCFQKHSQNKLFLYSLVGKLIEAQNLTN